MIGDIAFNSVFNIYHVVSIFCCFGLLHIFCGLQSYEDFCTI